MKVIKRDGTEVAFDWSKIKSAISKANERTQEMKIEDLDIIVNAVIAGCEEASKESIGVEEIQDLVVNALFDHGFKETGKTYLLYREQRTRNRQVKTKLLKEIGEKIKASNIVNQNANIDEFSFGGRKGEASNELMKWFALNNCVSKMARDNHLNNEIYIHDLDSYAVGMHNCLSIPFDKLLAEGFNTRQTDIRPASSINTAFQLVAVIFQLQSLQQFGGVSATHLDWTMVPYVKKSFYKHYQDGVKYLLGLDPVEYVTKETNIDDDSYKKLGEVAYNYAMDMTQRELKQAVEGMYHNLNN